MPYVHAEGEATISVEPRKLDVDKGSKVWRGVCFGIPNYQIGRQKRAGGDGRKAGV